VNQTACELCAAGSYSTSSNDACVACPPHAGSPPGSASSAECACSPGYSGRYDSCKACPRGRYKTSSGSEACDACAPGRYLPQEASTSEAACMPCPEGTLSVMAGAVSSAMCDVCPLGKFREAPSNTSQASSGSEIVCADCPPGSYRSTYAQESCLPCPSSSGAGGGSHVCSCLAGSFSSTGMAPCTKCAVGSFSDIREARNCSWCDAGKTSTQGYTACVACAPGRFSAPHLAVPTCADCPTNTFTNTSGASACQACAPKSFTRASAAWVLTTEAGQGGGGGAAAAAAATRGKYVINMTRGQATCSPCPHIWVEPEFYQFRQMDVPPQVPSCLTFHPTPRTIHPAPAPYTLHPTLSTLHPALQT